MTDSVADARARFYRMLALALALGILVAGILGFAGLTGPGVFTPDEAMFSLTVALLVTAFVLLVVLLRMVSVFDTVDQIRAHTVDASRQDEQARHRLEQGVEDAKLALRTELADARAAQKRALDDTQARLARDNEAFQRGLSGELRQAVDREVAGLKSSTERAVQEASSRLTRAEAALAKASEAANERARMDLAATQKKEVIVMNKEAEVTQQIKDLQLATATLGRDLKSVEKRVAEAMDALEHREMESAAETAQAQRELADVRKRGELLIIKNRQLEQAATVVEEKPPVRLTETDEREHVIAIEGIGTKFAARLNAAGVISIPQLVKADADQIATRIDATTELVKEWQAMGRLIQVRGVGPQYAEVLVKAGVRSVEQLAAADALDVARRVQKLEEERKVRLQGGKVSEGTVNRWIQAARARDFA